MNEITNPKSTAVGAVAVNPFLAYGEAQNQRAVVGRLLRFSKGDYFAGQDNEEVEKGTQFIANMDEMLAGWIRWEANKPTDHVMGKVSDGYQPPRRNELGDADKDAWEVDLAGEPRDPWQFSNYLLLKGTGDDSELYTFTTSSKGGLNALGDLCKNYGQAMAQRPDDYPVIALGVNAYDHPNRALGRIKVPTFKIVGWAPKGVFANNVDIIAGSGGAAEDLPVSKKAKARI
jgi:hypothetical protein